MPVIVVTFGLVVVVWAAIFARRAPLVAGVGLLLVVAYILGHEFWNARIGPFPLTLDRVLLAGLFGAALVQWRSGRLNLRILTGSDVLLAVLLFVLVVSAALSGDAGAIHGAASKWGRLLASFLIPASIYLLVRQIPLTVRDWQLLLAAMALLGVYLAGTAICEVAGLWSLVFPNYIADPNLGIHFGRARGPDLNSVSLGVYLTACAVCAWMLIPHVRQRWQQLALLCSLPLFAFGLLLTYTRSTYIGCAAAVMIVAAFQVPRRWLAPAAMCGLLLATVMFCAAWGHLMGIEREGAAGDAEHSVNQRASFAYISWQMFCDRPILGVGYGRFYDAKLPYLSDRRQQVELESIRGLHHHNTLLSVLTETGMVGLAAFLAVIVSWGHSAWKLASRANAPWMRAQGVLMLALMANYLSSAVFHDLTLLPSQELLLFMMAALTVNLHQVAASADLSVSNSRMVYSMPCPAQTC